MISLHKSYLLCISDLREFSLTYFLYYTSVEVTATMMTSITYLLYIAQVYSHTCTFMDFNYNSGTWQNNRSGSEEVKT